jgi:hypothetical protein
MDFIDGVGWWRDDTMWFHKQETSLHFLFSMFIIDCHELKTKSKKPRHVEKRLVSRPCSDKSVQRDMDLHSERRQSLLDKKSQSCSVAYKRAKWICRTQKRSLLVSSLQKQKQLNEKLRKSELRRLGLLERDQAAFTIQKWYRTRKWLPLVKVHQKIGLTREKALEMGFDALVSKLSNPSLIKLSNFLVLRAKKMVGGVPCKQPGKILLSAFVVSCYPQEVSPPSALMECASRFLSVLELFTSPSYADLLLPLATLFYSTFQEFKQMFDDWKQKDKKEMVLEYVQRVMDLDSLWWNVKDTDAVEEWEPAIDEQFSQHLARIQKLEGVMVLSKKRQEWVAGKEWPHTSEFTASPTVLFPRTKPSTDIPEMEIEKEPVEFGTLLSNEYLAHELIMDPDFKMEKPKMDEMTTRVHEIARKAYKDSLASQLERKEYHKLVQGLIQEYKQV